MTESMMEKVEFFTAYALQGLLSNPQYNTPQYAKWLQMKNLSIEKLAVLSAIETVQRLELYKEAVKSGKLGDLKQEKPSNISLVDS